MKKYFIAAAVAVLAFAMAAFASDLTVDGGVLQAGQDNDLTCADSADVSYATQTVGGGEFAVTEATVEFRDENGNLTGACNGQWAYIATFTTPTSQTGFAIGQISSGSVTFDVDEANPDSEVDEIEAVSVMVKSSDDSGGAGFTSGIFDV